MVSIETPKVQSIKNKKVIKSRRSKEKAQSQPPLVQKFDDSFEEVWD